MIFVGVLRVRYKDFDVAAEILQADSSTLQRSGAFARASGNRDSFFTALRSNTRFIVLERCADRPN
jgi:hypothetical protein